MSTITSPRPNKRRSKTIAFRLAASFGSVIALLLVMSAVADARLGVPRLQSPASRATVQSLPAFTWGSVRGAASYQFEFSASRNFSSSVSGFSSNPMSLSNTAISNDSTIPNGTYYWRARAVSAKDVPGRWTAIRKLVKRWNAAPVLNSPVGTTINWPTSPLIFSWTPVAHAVNYVLEVGTSPSLSSLVYGPINVQGPQYAFPSALAPNTYYWAVQPVDAGGQLGTRSKVQSFTWSWPSQTTLKEADVSPDGTYEEPSFSWTAVPGAASYEVQVSTDPSYPANAIILDATGVIGTSYTATNFFPNHTTLYWRMRAIDAKNDAGAWNSGQSFTESFDQQSPTIQNLHVYDANGIVDGQGTSNPILRWSPVAGASDYQITLAVWTPQTGCDFNASPATIRTPATAWTPSGTNYNATWEGSEYGWPSSANGGNSIIYFTAGPGSSTPVCVSLIALRDDAPLAGTTIESAPTLLGNGSTPAFTYNEPGTGSGSLGTPTAPDIVTYSPGIVPPAAGSGSVPAGSTLSTTPLFEWQPVAGASGYYVVIANDQGFDPNSIVTGGYTNTTSWQSTVPLKDQSSSYWWEVIPVATNGQPVGNAEGGYDPQPFNKSSAPPTPVSPVDGANVPTQPTFSWNSAQAAQNYTLEVSADPSFANPIQTVTTDSTSYTSTATLPAGQTLYWRVRANDISNNLNWSATQTFTHNLPAPGSLHSNPATGSAIPLLSWSAVTGAIGYNLQVTTGSNTSIDSVDTPDLTPAEFLNAGISHLEVQSVFPGGLTSAYSSLVTYDRTIPAPSRIRATKSGTRILVTWASDPIAKGYQIQLSTTPGFSSPLAADITANTAWVPQINAADAKVKLYWRLAVVDYANNVGAYHTGVFKAPHKKSKKKATKKKAGKKKPTKKKRKK